MPKLIAGVLLFVLFSSVAFAQTGQVIGKIADTSKNKNLAK